MCLCACLSDRPAAQSRSPAGRPPQTKNKKTKQRFKDSRVCGPDRKGRGQRTQGVIDPPGPFRRKDGLSWINHHLGEF